MNSTVKNLVLVVVLVIVAGSIWYLEARKAVNPANNAAVEEVKVNNSNEINADSATRVAEKKRKYEVAKEITTPDGFVNTDGVKVSDLIGKKVILIDFWTYSCINCQRTFPYLNAWYDSYKDQGLEILAVHTPEFDFEKNYDNVKRAVEKFGIKYPVILDNDYSTWQAYKNRYWPRKYLIDIDGFVVYDHIGEGGYEETEQKIVELLNERAQVLGENAVQMKEEKIVADEDFPAVKTPEIYFGYSRLQTLQNLPSRQCFDQECDFSLSDKKLSNDTFALEGKWKILAEKIQSALAGDSIYLNFEADQVNLVAGSVNDKPVRAEIYVDGQLIDATFAGSDVKDGVVTITGHNLYNLIDLKGKPGRHVVRIKLLNAGVEAFTFTFG